MTHPAYAFAVACGRFEKLCLEDPRAESKRLPELFAVVAELVALAPHLPRQWSGEGPVLASSPGTRKDIADRHPSLGLYVAAPAGGWGEDDTDGLPSCVVGDAIDDLLDIHRDLHAGQRLWSAGGWTDAAGFWGWMFSIHWGDHAVELLRVLHQTLESQREG